MPLLSTASCYGFLDLVSLLHFNGGFFEAPLKNRL